MAESSSPIATPINNMKFPLDIQTTELFDDLFSFYGTLDAEGTMLIMRGKIFEKTFTDPKLLSGHKFTDTVFWQTSEPNYQMVKNAVDAACKGIMSKTILSFRISAEEKSVIELSLCPVYKGENGNRKIKHIFLAGQDISDREKEIEFYKKRSEQLLYAAENADIGLWFWDLAEGSIFSTPKCNDFFEMQPHEILTYPAILEVIHPDDRDKLVRDITEAQEKGEEYDVEYRVIYSDGSIHWLSTRGKTYLDAEGAPSTMMGVVRRITERKNVHVHALRPGQRLHTRYHERALHRLGRRNCPHGVRARWSQSGRGGNQSRCRPAGDEVFRS
jgi:PAS domain S-box-containing protein